MQVGTGKSVLNGIAIGKLKIYKKKDTAISAAEVADTAAEVARLKKRSKRPLSSRLRCMKRHWQRLARTSPRCSTSTP
mgnify:FL=1